MDIETFYDTEKLITSDFSIVVLIDYLDHFPNLLLHTQNEKEK